MGGADALSELWVRGHRQQQDREPDPSDSARAQDPAVRREPARDCRHEPDPVSEPEGTRALRLSEGCARAPARSALQPDRGFSAASLAGICTAVWPRAASRWICRALAS